MADTQTAYDRLIQNVYAPVFFNKLAHAWNIHPTTEEEAVDMLKSAGKLRNLYELEQVKQASQKTNFVSSINNQLDQHLASYGYAASDQNTAVKEAAANVLKQPEIKDAASTLYAYLVENGQI